MKTREQALEDLRRIVGEQGAILDTLTPEEAAARVWRPGRRSLEDPAEEFRRTRCRRDVSLLAGGASIAGKR